MDLRTPRERQRDRIETTIGVVLIAAVLAFGTLFIVARTTNVLEEVPTPTPTVEPTATVNPDTIPLTFTPIQFTPRVSYGGLLVVEIFTDPGTQCRMVATVFSLTAGNYQNRVLVDAVTDGSGVCRGTMPVDTQIATGEHTVGISLRNGGRSQQVRWSFQVSP